MKLSARLSFFVFSLLILTETENLNAQVLQVDSVTVDSVWNSDSIWVNPDKSTTRRRLRDCKVSFTIRGIGMAKLFFYLSQDSGRIFFAPRTGSEVFYLDSTFTSLVPTGYKYSCTVRIGGGDRMGAVFKIVARQAVPVISGTPKFIPAGITRHLTQGDSISAPLIVQNINADKIDLCPIEKYYWDVLGDGTIDDSTDNKTPQWTWSTTVPDQGPAQRRYVIVCALDKNGMRSLPETLTVQFGLHTPIKMVDLEGGTFRMGQAGGVDEPIHNVNLSPYAIQDGEVTNEQYIALISGIKQVQYDTGLAGLISPLKDITWYNAARFCNKLNKLLKYDTIYDESTWNADFSKAGFRLPTEAEWEFACRGGTTTTYWWGPDTVGMGNVQKMANPFGLYNFNGISYEWCNDWFTLYSVDDQVNPTGPATGTLRATRGQGGSGKRAFQKLTEPGTKTNFRVVFSKGFH